MLGLASVFLPWSEMGYGTQYIEVRLIDLMVEGGEADLPLPIFGTAFIAGLLLSLMWKKGWWLQLSGLLPLTPALLLSTGEAMGFEGTIGSMAAALPKIGLGFYIAWTATLISIPLHRSKFTSRERGRGRCRGRGSPRDRSGSDNACLIKIAPRSRRGAVVSAQGASATYDDAMDQGNLALSHGDLDSALRAYGRALGASRGVRERAACKVQISLALGRMGDLEEAHLFLHEAKALDPGSWNGGQGTARLLPMKRPTSKKRIRFGLSPEP